MNLALITAAGIGTRINGNIPKQFTNVGGRPIIVYTLAAFQNHPDIDAICIVVLRGWCDVVRKYAQEFNITKPLHIVTGGATGQESISIGLSKLQGLYGADDIVLIHDGVRPLVSADMITDCIRTTIAHGNAIAAIPCQEAIMRLDTDNCYSSIKSVPRETLCRTQTPHGFRLGDAVALYNDAGRIGLKNAVAACTIMAALGRRVFFYSGAEKNLKITTSEDLDIFKAFLQVDK